MKLVTGTLLLLAVVGNVAYAQTQELRWGEFGCYSNWKRYPYEIESEYEFIGRLPDLREFPKLLEAAADPKMKQSEREIISSQLRTLSRCDFHKSLNAGDDAEAEHRSAVAKWKDWWDAYGSKLPGALAERGQRYEKAWTQVAPTPYLRIPSYPILIPKAWSSTISFRSGDYGGVTEEVIEFHVTEDACTLRRRYRTGWMAQEPPWTHEEWREFSRKEADHFLASLIYLIDNPWFYSRDEISESEDGDARSKIGHILGRPEAWTDYYPGYEWTGILDADQRVIINHDPWNWDSIDHELGPKTSLDGDAFGIVFRLVRDLFPDPSWDSDSSRWKRVESATNEVGEQEAPPSSGAVAPDAKSKDGYKDGGQVCEFDQRDFSEFTAKNLVFPLKEIVPRAKIESREVSMAYRCSMKSGWSFEDLVALRYGQSKWLLCWRFDSGPAGATVGSKFISELSEDQKRAAEEWLALAENEELWSGPQVVGDPTGFDDGWRVVVARFAHDAYSFRAFHQSGGIQFPKNLDRLTEQSQKVLASLQNKQLKAEQNEVDRPAAPKAKSELGDKESGDACEIHHQPFKRVSGYSPDPAVTVSPEYGGTEFRAQFGHQYPHIRPWTFSPTRKESWNMEISVEVCGECERAYDQAFAAYLQIDENVRRDQYMEFLKNHPSRAPQGGDKNKDATPAGALDHLPSDIPPP